MPMVSPVIEQHFSRLKERYPAATLSPLAGGAALITVPKCPLRPEWSVPEATLRFIAPNGYSVASPDCFWVEPNLYLPNQTLPKNSGQNNQIPETGIAALALDQPIRDTAVADASTRFLARGGQWSPSAAVRRRIEQTALGREKCQRV